MNDPISVQAISADCYEMLTSMDVQDFVDEYGYDYDEIMPIYQNLVNRLQRGKIQGHSGSSEDCYYIPIAEPWEFEEREILYYLYDLGEFGCDPDADASLLYWSTQVAEGPF